MSLAALVIPRIDYLPLPDAVTAFGVHALCYKTSRAFKPVPANVNQDFARRMSALRIAEATDAANVQHYEVPAAFFAHVLGPQRKYSSCLFEDGVTTLDQAEQRALAETAAHAGLVDGQDILELGCGWGSLSLYMAGLFPGARITSVSNSHSQKEYITAEARRRGLANLRVITCDMNDFAPDGQFDRVVSVEMFEHMSNWQTLLRRIGGWLKPGGKLFLHVFSHKTTPYAFDAGDPTDWIAQHFFTGGIMPSHDLIRSYDDALKVEAEWRWSGTHYRKTALAWLRNFDRNRDAITPILAATYGSDAVIWGRRWRRFFLATAGLFGFDRGREWGVSHYLLSRV